MIQSKKKGISKVTTVEAAGGSSGVSSGNMMKGLKRPFKGKERGGVRHSKKRHTSD